MTTKINDVHRVLAAFLVVSIIFGAISVISTHDNKMTEKDAKTKADILKQGRYVAYLAANYGGNEDMPTIESGDVYLHYLNVTYGIPYEDFFQQGHIEFLT
jgi:hypothetical protein